MKRATILGRAGIGWLNSSLAEQPMYGYQIARELERRSEDYFTMKEGLLYPALHQMERDNLLRSEWRTVAGARRRKYYIITDKGRKALADSVTEWQTFIEQLLGIIGGQRCWLSVGSSAWGRCGALSTASSGNGG